jgi:chromate transporter
MNDYTKPSPLPLESPATEQPKLTRPCLLKQLLLYFLHLSTFGFGGPITLASYMQRGLVEQRRWISKQNYVQGLALAQLAMYLG